MAPLKLEDWRNWRSGTDGTAQKRKASARRGDQAPCFLEVGGGLVAHRGDGAQVGPDVGDARRVVGVQSGSPARPWW